MPRRPIIAARWRASAAGGGGSSCRSRSPGLRTVAGADAAAALADPGSQWDRVHQRQELGDVVSVAAAERDGRRGAVVVDDQVVL